MEIDAGGPEGLLNAVRTGMGLDTGGAELAASSRGRTGVMHSSASRHSSGNWMRHGRKQGGGPSPPRQTRDADSAFRVSDRLADIFLTLKGTPRQTPRYRKAGDRQRSMILTKKRSAPPRSCSSVSANAMPCSARAGRRSPCSACSSAPRVLPGREAPGRTPGFRRPRESMPIACSGRRSPGHPVLARPEGPPLPRRRVPGHERHPVGDPLRLTEEIFAARARTRAWSPPCSWWATRSSPSTASARRTTGSSTTSGREWNSCPGPRAISGRWTELPLRAGDRRRRERGVRSALAGRLPALGGCPLNPPGQRAAHRGPAVRGGCRRRAD